MTELLSFWYGWGVFVGVFLAAAVAIYIFFDARRAVAPGRAAGPRILGLVGLALTLPSLYYRLTKIEEAADLTPLFEVDGNFSLFFYLALIGVLLAFGALTYYLRSVRRPEPVYTTPVYSPPVAVAPSPPVEPAPEDPLLPTLPPHRPTEILDKRDPLPMAWLVVKEGPRAGHSFRLLEATTIGKDADNDVILDESTVSFHHAKVKFEDGVFALHDLASTNGTYIYDAEQQEWRREYRVPLRHGLQVKLGRNTLVFMSLDGATEPTKQPIQSLRLDAAVPEEVVVHRPFKLVVAVRQEKSQQLDVPGLGNVRSEEIVVDIPKGQTRVLLTVHIEPIGCRIVGYSSRSFFVYAGRDSKDLHFTLIPYQVGEISITVRVMQESFIDLGDAPLTVIVREHKIGEVDISTTSRQLKPTYADPTPALMAELNNFINPRFDEDEVRGIIFDMGIDYENLGGDSKSAKIRELILFCQRHNRLDELRERIIQARPHWYLEL